MQGHCPALFLVAELLLPRLAGLGQGGSSTLPVSGEGHGGVGDVAGRGAGGGDVGDEAVLGCDGAVGFEFGEGGAGEEAEA